MASNLLSDKIPTQISGQRVKKNPAIDLCQYSGYLLGYKRGEMLQTEFCTFGFDKKKQPRCTFAQTQCCAFVEKQNNYLRCSSLSGWLVGVLFLLGFNTKKLFTHLTDIEINLT